MVVSVKSELKISVKSIKRHKRAKQKILLRDLNSPRKYVSPKILETKHHSHPPIYTTLSCHHFRHSLSQTPNFLFSRRSRPLPNQQTSRRPHQHNMSAMSVSQRVVCSFTPDTGNGCRPALDCLPPHYRQASQLSQGSLARRH